MTIPNSSMLKFLLAAIISFQNFSIGQIKPDLTFEKSKIVAGLKHPDWPERAYAVQSIPSTHLTDPEISEMLINLLSSENDSYWTIVRGPAEAWGEYYHFLVQKVGETGNDKAIPVLIKSIYAGGGNRASKAIAKFGDEGMLALLHAIQKPNDGIIRDYGTVRNEVVDEIIVFKHAMDYIANSGYILSDSIKKRIILEVIPLTTDYSQVPAVRIDATKILGHIDDPEVIAHLEYLAASDPYYVDYFIPGKRGKRIKGHPVRKEAKIQLKNIKKSRQE